MKLETPHLDLDLPPINRELLFGLHVLPGALIACLHIGIIEKLSAGTIDVLNVARRSYRLAILAAPSL